MKNSGTDVRKTYDKWLILCVLVLILLLGGAFWSAQKPPADGMVVVTVDGTLYARYPLMQDRTERIEGADGAYNVLEIRGGKADITEASCPDGICAAHRKISKSNQTIVCLPNRVVVEIREAEENEVDFSVY